MFSISSPAFEHEHAIPERYTCEGEDISPPLEWTGIPPGTKSLALIVDDPDAPDPRAPRTRFVHWLVYNLPPGLPGLHEEIRAHNVPDGAGEGRSDFGRVGYGGPCPPIGRHRYFFTLYALDERLPLMGAPSRAELERAMKGHVIGETELIGTYMKHAG